MGDLNCYLIMFSRYEGREWVCYGGYMFAKDESSITNLLKETYGQIWVRMIEKIDIQEGTILYGKQWRML